MGKITDLVSGIPLELPPLHEVNHEINLVEPMKRIRYWLPKCPEHFLEDLSVKIERYTTAEWWVPAVVHQAVPMLCVPKKNGTLCWVQTCIRADSNPNYIPEPNLFRILFQTTHTVIP
jgi:hypothetical protein